MAKGYVIGIDIGGTKIRGALFSRNHVLRYRETSTPKNITAFKKALQRLVSKMSNIQCLTLGIGAAGVVKGGVLVKSPNIPYIKNLDLKRLFQSFEVKLDNDARCFLRGEYFFCAAKEVKKAFGLTLGTGIGRAYGEIKKGEIAIKPVKKFEYPETFERKYQRLRDAGDDRKLAKFLAEKLTPIIKRYNPDLLVIGGGVSNRENFLNTLRHEFKKYGLKVRAVKAMLGNNSVALGAAMLF